MSYHTPSATPAVKPPVPLFRDAVLENRLIALHGPPEVAKIWSRTFSLKVVGAVTALAFIDHDRAVCTQSASIRVPGA